MDQAGLLLASSLLGLHLDLACLQFMIASDLDGYGPGEFAHIFPRSTMVVVGGIKQYDSPSVEVLEAEINS